MFEREENRDLYVVDMYCVRCVCMLSRDGGPFEPILDLEEKVIGIIDIEIALIFVARRGSLSPRRFTKAF